MKIRFRLLASFIIWMWFLSCFSAKAQTLKELLERADSLSNMAKYDSAIALTEQALRKAESQFGESDTTLAIILHRLSVFQIYQKADYDSALSLAERALAIRERVLGANHADVGKSLNTIGFVYGLQGRYKEAESIHLRGLTILEKSLGMTHPLVAMVAENLANDYSEDGKYALAEPLYKQALTIREMSLGVDDPQVAITLNNLGCLYAVQGRYAEAEPILKRSLSIKEKTLGMNHVRVAISLESLADLYRAQGKDGDAEPLLKRALIIREKALGPNHPYVGQALDNLAKLYTDLGRYTEAESLLTRALLIYEASVGHVHPETARSIKNMANLRRDQNKYGEADSLYREALTVSEKTLGLNHPYAADILHDQALFLRDMRDFTNSQKSSKRAYTIRRANFRDGSCVLSEKDALTYSKFMRDEAGQYLSILLDSRDTSSSCRAEIAKVVFSTKGQVSDGIFARYKTHLYERHPGLKVLSDSLRNARFRLANLYVQTPTQEEPGEYRQKLDEAAKEKERLETELARQSTDFRRESELWEVNAAKIASALPAKSILVEYMKYDRLKTSRESETHYLLVVVDTSGEIFVSDLGRSDQIDSMVTSYRSHFKDISARGGTIFSKDLEDYKRISTNLYDRIWKPVENKLHGASLVFIAPDGALNLISFAGLSDGSRESKGTMNYLIEKYPIQYLSSGRDLLRLKEPAKPGKGLFALGDPDFNASALTRLSSSSVSAETRGSGTLRETLRSVRPYQERLKTTEVMALPGSRQEVERISDAWKKKTKEPCCVFLGINASEENFKKNAPGNRVIHLATHGYYVKSEFQTEHLPERSGMMESFTSENPLLLSGLFLAGANLHRETADSLGAEDGILTAEEVTGIDLEGTNWVVLSACESGLGEVKSGEGVYGLRRAFQMAGARTVISALWPVTDKTTVEIMSYLYNFEDENLACAMRNLAIKKLTELRRKNQPDHPYLWAGFIALGDWK
jgi:CHAT domain-containing protein/tetratricopeptide (TPR) repeat protein